MIRCFLSTITLLVSASAAFAQSTSSSPFSLLDATRCGAGNAVNGVAVGDVTLNGVNAIDCWGAFDGNAPTTGQNNTIEIVGQPAPFTGVYDYQSKIEQGGQEGTPPLTVTGPGGENDPFDRTSGNWSFPGFGDHSFLITLKSSNQWAVWLFAGAGDGPYSGTWSIWDNQALSNFAVFKGGPSVPPEPPAGVPVPPSLALLALGLAALVGGKRRRSQAPRLSA